MHSRTRDFPMKQRGLVCQPLTGLVLGYCSGEQQLSRIEQKKTGCFKQYEKNEELVLFVKASVCLHR